MASWFHRFFRLRTNFWSLYCGVQKPFRYLWVFIPSQFTHTLLFLVVNVFFGALGFLVPLAIEYLSTDAFTPALKKQLDASGAYTFAIAFLASSVSLVAAEYLDAVEVPKYRKWKVTFCALASLLMVVCAVFSGSQTARTIFMGSNSAVPFSQSYGSSEVSPMQEVKLEARISEIPRHAMENAKLTSFDKLQLFSTLFAIIIGLILFLVFKFQSPSMQQQIEKIEAQMADAASGLMSGLTIG